MIDQIVFENIPQKIKEIPHWVNWRAKLKDDGKVDKLPINPTTNRLAATNNPKSWSSYIEALRHYRKNNGNGVDGLGFVFSDKDDLVGIDFDDCRNPKTGEIELWAQAYLDKMWSYCEITPSGRGLHILASGSLPGAGRKKGKVEIYDKGRFFTITGRHLEGTPTIIEHRQKEIQTFYYNVFGKEEKPKPIETKPTLLSDSEILERATSAKNGEKFSKLMEGDYSDYPSQSEADLALCNALVFWCGNSPEQIDRLFRQSKLYRKKWDEKHGEKTYGEMTILKAIQNTTETFTLGGGIYEPVKNHTLEMLNQNEVGDARLFIEQNYGKFVYDHSVGRWYEWHNHYWKEDIANRVMAALEKVNAEYYQEIGRQNQKRLEAEKAKQTEKAAQHEEKVNELFKRIRALQSAKRRENVLKLASVDWTQEGYKSLAITGNEWDRDPMILGCRNGVVELTTGDFRPGRLEDYVKSVAPTEWKGIDTPAPMWERFLKEIFDDDTELIAYIQRLLGYASTGKVTEHIFPILEGKGRNGKGTLLEGINFVLGDLAGPVEAELLLDSYRARQSGSPTSDIMALRGKRLVWASETKQGRSLNIGKLKWLTGADTRVGRPPFGKHQITYTPTDTLFLLTNHKPRVPANEYSTWERIHLIPFKLSFVDEPKKDFERQRDPDLLDKLKAEAPGILVWLVRGCLEWTYQGLNPPETVKAATADYRKDEDIIGHFISDWCVLRDGAEVKAGELYKAYQKWCEGMGHKVINGTRFGKEMKERFDSYKDGYVFYAGVELLNE